MKKELINQRIEQFTSGELGGNELQQFLQQMENNEELKKELELHYLIEKAVRDKDMNELRNTLKQIRAKHIASAKKHKRLQPHVYMIAASIAVVIAFGAIFSKGIFTNTPQDLFDSYYEVYNSSLNMRSGAIKTSEILASALQYYDNGEYQSAQNLFNQYLENDPLNVAVNFYLGITYIETNELKKAEKSFQKLTEIEGNLFEEQAQWFLGLTYLRMNNVDQARMTFEKISNSSSFYRNKASEILSEL